MRETLLTTKHRAFVALGSNLGNRAAFLQLAIDELPDVYRISPVYETEPIEVSTWQPAYFNAVVELRTSLDVRSLFAVTKAIEAKAEREREMPHGPRTLDVDLLLYNDLCILESDLVVPHPRMWQRRFVMQPLSDIAPDVMPSNWQLHLSAGDIRRTDITFKL